MKRILIIMFLVTFIKVQAQDFIFFSDSPSGNYYDPSWGFVNQPSSLEIVNSVKFPVSGSVYFSGLNSLKLHWTSVSGGDWGMAAADPNWSGHNTRLQDSI